MQRELRAKEREHASTGRNEVHGRDPAESNRSYMAEQLGSPNVRPSTR
jgi:hypothetical protein